MLNPNVNTFKLQLSCEGKIVREQLWAKHGAFTQKKIIPIILMESKWAWWKISSSGKSWVITHDAVNNLRHSSRHKGHNGLRSSSPVSEEVAGSILTSQTPWLHCQLFCQTLSSVWQAITSNGFNSFGARSLPASVCTDSCRNPTFSERSPKRRINLS